MSKIILFTRPLYSFLLASGYTHIYLRGIQSKPESDNTQNDDDYILVPWKKGITLFEDGDLMMEEIKSTDVTDMLDVEFGMQFWAELPEDVVSSFEKL